MNLFDHSGVVAAGVAIGVTTVAKATDAELPAETIGLAVILFVAVKELFSLVRLAMDQREKKRAAAAGEDDQEEVVAAVGPMPPDYFQRFVQSSESNGQRIEALTREVRGVNARLDRIVCPLHSADGARRLQDLITMKSECRLPIEPSAGRGDHLKS